MFYRCLLLLLLPAFLAACSANSSRESEQDRWMALLNERRYDEAVKELEAALAENPSDREKAYLLSMAYLGAGHAEMLDFLQRTLAEQPPQTPGSALKSNCDRSNWDRHSLKGRSVACILERLMDQTPTRENQGVKKASALLLQYYPSPALEPQEVNFLIAYVQLYRALNRARIMTSDHTYDQILSLKRQSHIPRAEANRLFGFTVHNIKGLFTELMETLRRLKYSYAKIAKHTKSLDGRPLVEWRGHQLVFDDQLTMAEIARFGVSVLAEQADTLDASINEAISGELYAVAPNLLRAGRLLSFFATPSGTPEKLTLSLKVTRALEQMLGSAGRQEGGADPNRNLFPNFAQKFWNAPPGIFGQLANSIGDAWKTESLDPLFAFHAQTEQEWRDLARIASRWEALLSKGETMGLEENLVHYFAERRTQDPSFLLPPISMGSDEVNSYLRALQRECDLALELMKRGDIPGLDQIGPADQAELHSLWLSSKQWFEKNVIEPEQAT